jgi:hypothetical protein
MSDHTGLLAVKVAALHEPRDGANGTNAEAKRRGAGGVKGLDQLVALLLHLQSNRLLSTFSLIAKPMSKMKNMMKAMSGESGGPGDISNYPRGFGKKR